MDSEDRQTKLLMEVWKWADTHRKHVAWGVILLALIGAWAGFYFWHESQREFTANTALSGAIHQSLNGDVQAPSMDALTKVAAEHPNTSAGQRALLFAGADYFTQGKYAEAKAQFERSLREYPNTPFSSQASFAIAVILEAEGKTNEAMTAYKDLVDRYPSDNVVPQALLALGRLNEAQGKLTQARDYYLQVGRVVPGSSTIGTQAAIRLKDIFEKHPELIPTSHSATTNAPLLELNRP